MPTNEPQTTPEPTEATPPLAPDQDRARFLAQAVNRIAAVLTDQMLREALAPSSTDSPSLADRAMLAVLSPWMPKLRAALLSKLSEVDGATLERHLGALAKSLDELLAAAPGEPLPRMVYRWAGDGGLIMVPCPTCPGAGDG